MTIKQQILEALEIEIKICKRLFTLLPVDLYEYTPAEGMRSTLRLLRYISWITGATLEQYIEDPEYKSNEIYDIGSSKAKTMKPEEFPARMDIELEKIYSLMEQISDEDLFNKEVTLPWREKKMLGAAIIETTLKWITGYKMQLYLYAKMSGVKDIDTGDCWFVY